MVQVTVTTVVLINLEIDDHENDDTEDHDKTCIVEGGKVGRKIELEGNVDSGNATAFKMKINGERSSGLVDVNALNAQFKCNGDKGSAAPCKDSVKPHAKVHVSGTLMTCTTINAQVTATEVKVQKAEDGEDDD